MRIHFAAIFLLAGLQTQASETCETAMGRGGLAVARLLRAAVRTQSLTAKSLESFVLDASSSDPFNANGRSPRDLSFRQRFARHWNVMTSDQKNATRRGLENFLAEVKADAASVEEAEEQTSQVINLRKMDQMRINGNVQLGSNNLIFGWLEDRPVMMATLSDRDTTQDFVDVLYDPFHPQFSEREKTLPTDPPRSSGLDLQFFYLGQKTFAAKLYDNFVYDFSTREPLFPEYLKVVKESQSGSTLVLDLPQGPRLFVVAKERPTDPVTRNLLVYDLASPAQNPSVLAHGALTTLEQSKGKDYHYLEVGELGDGKRGHSTFGIYDVQNELKLVKRLEIPGLETKVIKIKDRLVVAYLKVVQANPPLFSLRLLDVKAGKTKKAVGEHNISSAIEVHEMNGVPFTFFRTQNGFVVTNLETMEEAAYGGFELLQDAKWITHSNRDYILLNHGNKVVLFDLRSESLVTELEFSGMITKIVPFTYKNQIFAFVGERRTLPSLIQITQREVGAQ